jgi:phosphate/sulfate permease
LVVLWSVISFILLFVISIFIFGFLAIVFISLILTVFENRKNKEFRETFKTYKYNKVPSQFYIYK